MLAYQLYGSPTQVLLDQEPDPYAIGYNGSYVHMLPRCARAIETGYFYPKQQPVIESELPELAHDFHDMALEDYTGDIDSHNQQLFGYLQYAICEELQIPLQRIGCTYNETTPTLRCTRSMTEKYVYISGDCGMPIIHAPMVARLPKDCLTS